MDYHYFDVSVNLPNEEKLAGREELARGGSQDKEELLTKAPPNAPPCTGAKPST